MKKITYTPGQVLGNAIYLRDTVSNTKKIKAVFQCVCGCEFIADRQKVKSGHTSSCGCLKITTTIAYNKSRKTEFPPNAGLNSLTYHTWQGAKRRTTSNRHYLSRGITMCDRWFNSYPNFLEDMGIKPEGYSIERVDNNKGYNPENCVWSLPYAQALNKEPRKTNTEVEGVCERKGYASKPYSVNAKIIGKGTQAFCTLEEASNFYQEIVKLAKIKRLVQAQKDCYYGYSQPGI